MTPVRIGLGLVGLSLASSFAPDRGPALIGFALGTIGLTVAALADPRSRFFQARTPPRPLPDDALHASNWQMTRAKLFPSTVGVSLLAAAALAFEPVLAAILAGALAGMGVASLVTGVNVLWMERQEGVQVFVDEHGGLFTREGAQEASP